MASKQPKYILYGIWKKKWQEANQGRFNGSIHRDSAQLDRIIADIGYDETLELIDFYFQIRKRGHDFMWFIYNYDKLRESKFAYDKEAERSARVREATRRAMEEEK